MKDPRRNDRADTRGDVVRAKLDAQRIAAHRAATTNDDDREAGIRDAQLVLAGKDPEWDPQTPTTTSYRAGWQEAGDAALSMLGAIA